MGRRHKDRQKDKDEDTNAQGNEKIQLKSCLGKICGFDSNTPDVDGVMANKNWTCSLAYQLLEFI